MKTLICACLAIALLRGATIHAEDLNAWLLAQVQKDEQLLADALSQTDGHSLELLKDSPTYVPFFREPPDNQAANITGYEALFNQWSNGQSFLPGGYIYRLSFADAPPLYATSAGNWEGTTWRSLSLGKDLVIDPSRVWSGSHDAYLYATMLAGTRPKLVVYNRFGEMAKEEAFDASAADCNQRLASVEKSYAENGSPKLEMLSLAEYLDAPNAIWREVDLSGQFNFRNQQERDVERERLQPGLKLTRDAANRALRPESSPQETPQLLDSSEPRSVLKTSEAKQSTKATPKTEATTTSQTSRFPIVPVAIVVAVIVGIAIYVFRRKSP